MTQILKYPKDLNTNLTDYVIFTHSEYANNNNSRRSSTQQKASPPYDGNMIQLYMPNSTPPVNQEQQWGETSFRGPLGDYQRDVGSAAASAFTGDSSLFTAGSGEQLVERTGQVVGNVGSAILGGGDVNKLSMSAAQAIVGALAKNFTGRTLNNFMALNGQVFNPNVELLYSAPKLRNFTMSFTFIPKNISEAEEISKIIKEFKTWSAPGNPLDNGGLINVPHLWNVSYKGKVEGKMGQFKKCALVSVNTQDNAGLSMHSTFSDGSPLKTDIALTFLETDVITRQDHVNSTSERGF